MFFWATAAQDHESAAAARCSIMAVAHRWRRPVFVQLAEPARLGQKYHHGGHLNRHLRHRPSDLPLRPSWSRELAAELLRGRMQLPDRTQPRRKRRLLTHTRFTGGARKHVHLSVESVYLYGRVLVRRVSRCDGCVVGV